MSSDVIVRIGPQVHSVECDATPASEGRPCSHRYGCGTVIDRVPIKPEETA